MPAARRRIGTAVDVDWLTVATALDSRAHTLLHDLKVFQQKHSPDSDSIVSHATAVLVLTALRDAIRAGAIREGE